MKLHIILAIVLLLGFGGYATSKMPFIAPAFAEDGHKHHDNDDHDHDDHEEDDDHSGHDHEEHDDKDEHKHESHEGHDHDSHKEDEDHDDDHNGHSHDDHGHGGHDEHEEGKTKIDPNAAHQSGVRVSKAGSTTIKQSVTLTGRVMLNRNTTAEVRARFPGVVKSVKVNWGDKVKKGKTLAVVEANQSLKRYSVTAPTNGVVLTRNTNTGDVAGDKSLFTIADLSEVWAEFHVFPRDLSKIEKGQLVRIRTIDNNMEIEAPIKLILPTADPLSQTVIAVVSIPNEDGKWRPGITVEGDVYIGEEEVALAVTKDAIQSVHDENVVFVKKGNEYEAREVKLGKDDGKYVEVREGLKRGETYVSEGSFIIKADIGKSEAGHDH